MRRDMLRACTGDETFHSQEGLGPWLDTMSYKDYLEGVMGLDPGVTAYLDPILAISDYGMSCDVISAYGAYLLQLPGMRGYFGGDSVSFEAVKIMSWPGGNTTYARYIVKHLIPDAIAGERFEDIAMGPVNFGALDRTGSPVRIRQNSTVLDVRHDGDDVVVTYNRHARSSCRQAAGWHATSWPTCRTRSARTTNSSTTVRCWWSMSR
jgi:spermidine dehydrogenase